MPSSKMNEFIVKSHKINSQVLTNTRSVLEEPLANGLTLSTNSIRTYMDILFVDIMGVQPTTDGELAAAMVCIIVSTTLILYYTFVGNKHTRDRKQLKRELHAARMTVIELQEEIENEESKKQAEIIEDGREVRIFFEGAFDVMHYGHANGFRQARSLGTYLVAGVNSSESIEQCKGSCPIMNDDERLAVVAACKWVDEVVPRTPYIMTSEYLDWIIKTYKIDYVVHGDDPCIGPDGKDVYADVKSRGMFKSIPRTEGVSTTEIVGRMLLMNTSHHLKSSPGENEKNGLLVSDPKFSSSTHLPFGYRESRFLTTSRMLRLFSQPTPRSIEQGMKVVYINGGFDMFHAGHASILKKARALGDYLLVGVHNDGICNHYRGGSHPVLNLNERVLSVLACKYVDDVIIDPPYLITAEMIAALQINIVVTGKVSEVPEDAESDVYRVPSEMKILRMIDSGSTMTMGNVLTRIRENATRLENKVAKKMKAEAEHFKGKHKLDNYSTGYAN